MPMPLSTNGRSPEPEPAGDPPAARPAGLSATPESAAEARRAPPPAATGLPLAVPVIETPRLRLRAFAQSDLDAYAAMSADAEVMRHIGTGGPQGRDMAWRQMAGFLGHWVLRGHGMWALERRDDPGRLIGRVGFLDAEGWPACELGWLLAREAWGQGYALEAALAARQAGRDRLGLGELVSFIHPDNTRSIRLAERMGAVRDGSVSLMGMAVPQFRHPR
jgi:RimJ/RimL family protein N-acetyltransferase